MAWTCLTAWCVLVVLSHYKAETTTTDSTAAASTVATDTTTQAVVTDAPSESTTSAPHLRCYNCKFTRDLRSCHFARGCPDGSSCLLGQLTSGLFYLDCVPTPACAVLPATVQAQGTATFLGHEFKRFECCTTDKCNDNKDGTLGVGK